MTAEEAEKRMGLRTIEVANEFCKYIVRGFGKKNVAGTMLGTAMALKAQFKIWEKESNPKWFKELILQQLKDTEKIIIAMKESK